MFVLINYFRFLKAFKSLKILVGLSLFLILLNSSFAQDYKLVWSDEFDGTSLDTTKWSCQIGNRRGWGNNEKQYYRAENAVVNDGLLTIIAKQESFEGFDYTSARIHTINKGDWKYGKIEMRAKMPIGQGIWPAFWMMPTKSVYGGWPVSGEIDIMEYLGHETKIVHGTLHYGDKPPNNIYTGKPDTLESGNFHEEFHTFSVVWEEGKFQWFVDGELYQTQTKWNTVAAPFPAPFDKEFHIILNMAVGGNWPGYPDETTEFPQEYIIDYVRVYRKVDDQQK
ncbi:MAG: glycoside hydrolase family 16 protein [Ignavibacteria bacterium]|jgi:beta-glucanase (GH16 family)